jgi:hypothetical protein
MSDEGLAASPRSPSARKLSPMELAQHIGAVLSTTRDLVRECVAVIRIHGFSDEHPLTKAVMAHVRASMIDASPQGERVSEASATPGGSHD